MIRCDIFNGTTITASQQGLNRNRISFSSLPYLESEEITLPTYSIKYVLTGTEHYFLQGRKKSVGAGKFLIVNGDSALNININTTKKVTGLCLHLEASFLYDVYLHLSKSPEWLLDHPAEKHQALLFEELIQSDKENELGSFLKKTAARLNKSQKTIAFNEDHFYYELACRLLKSQKLFGTANHLRVQKSSTQQELLRRLAIAKQMIEAQGEKKPDIASLARQSSLSPSHLFRCFKQVYGLSPHQYQLQQRLHKAQTLLQQNQLSTTQVALHCGFADLASFSKAFKKMTGKNPSAFTR